ncbi:MAG: molybdenum cofactor biosynthesis protein MoaE [Acidimicrobiia bacterium]|nr:molybdenum cofactor biosynthesis protein MoaE [Acidimicrobiia bacterium]
MDVAHDPLPVGELSSWAAHPSCGAVVVFTGTSRDHAGDRTGVRLLRYEAYTEHVVTRLTAVVEALRSRWPTVGRVAVLHRLGDVPLTEASVAVAVSAPHRDEAFAAARFGIDTLKDTVPIWKQEVFDDGEAWALSAAPIGELPDAPSGRGVTR